MKNFFENCATLDALKAEYKRLAKRYHPDMGGDTATMQEINNQYEVAFNRMNGNATNGTNTAETAADFINIISALLKIKGITVEIVGNWIWCSGDTRPVKDELKAAGMRWASKKRMWYWHSGEYCKWSSHASMDAIRRKYGSRVVSRRDDAMAMA